MSGSVVRGEAAESDLSDDEDGESGSRVIFSAQPPRGAVVTGEAPESDEDLTPSVASSVTAHFASADSRDRPKPYESLLHKKLHECNVSLNKNICATLKNTINSSLAQLSHTDHLLLKSQLRLQQANSSLRTVESTSIQLAERFSIVASNSHIPHIVLPLPEVE